LLRLIQRTSFNQPIATSSLEIAMNIIETIVEESDVVEQAVNQAQPAVVEIDALALGLIGGGFVSPCFA